MIGHTHAGIVEQDIQLSASALLDLIPQGEDALSFCDVKGKRLDPFHFELSKGFSRPSSCKDAQAVRSEFERECVTGSTLRTTIRVKLR